MKRFFTLFCAALMTLGTINAEVLLTEHFGQKTETLSTSEKAGADAIETTGWTNISGSGQMYMSSTDMTYAGYKSETDGTGSVEYKATFGMKTATPLKTSVNSGSLYTAAIIKVNSAAGSATARDYIWAVCTKTEAFSNGNNHYSRLCFQQEGSGFKLGIAKQAESAAFISYTGELEYGKTYLVVTEYRWVDGEKNDTIRMYLNPTKGDKPTPTLICKQSAMNASGGEVGSGTKADAAQLVSFMLYSSASTKQNMLIDELKIVTDWADLWEAGGDTPQEPSPTITVVSSGNYGTVTVGEPASLKFGVLGSDLQGPISVASNNTALVPSVESITKAQAEAEGGYELTLTLTAAEAGEGSATVTLSSEDATSKTISISWNAVAPVSGALTIVEAKLLAEEAELALNDVVVTRIFQDGLAFSVQDATGALNIADYYGVCTSWKVGDKISGLSGMVLPSEDAMDGFCTIVPYSASVAESGVSIEPFEVSLSNFAQYGPALIKVQGVAFPDDVEKFTAGGITISQGAASANLQIPAGCDIIGEDVPASADVLGIVCHPYFTDNILLEKSTNLTNRVAKTPTGIGEVRSETTDVVRSEKVLRNGQLYLIYEGRIYNVQGAQVK